MKITKRFKTIEEYIETFPSGTAKMLKTLSKTIKEVAPKAEPTISYNMPAFKQDGILVYFAGFKSHIGLYPYPNTIKAFKKDLIKYKTAKSTVQFPLDKPLPLPLIRKILKFRLKEKIDSKKKK
jgi:uncharacterized protein YdhG (YjbR/CyaY superfamily)